MKWKTKPSSYLSDVLQIRMFINIASVGSWDYTDQDTTITRIIGKIWVRTRLHSRK